VFPVKLDLDIITRFDTLVDDLLLFPYLSKFRASPEDLSAASVYFLENERERLNYVEQNSKESPSH
jgi:hypothetical protein